MTEIIIDPDAIAHALDVLADATGEKRYVQAARLARGDTMAGRPEYDDRGALASVRERIKRGMGERKACAAVARRNAEPGKVRAMTRRLYAKLKKEAAN